MNDSFCPHGTFKDISSDDTEYKTRKSQLIKMNALSFQELKFLFNFVYAGIIILSNEIFFILFLSVRCCGCIILELAKFLLNNFKILSFHNTFIESCDN